MHSYELKSDTKNKTGQTWSHTPGREVRGDKAWSQLFPERTLTESQIMELWRWTAETSGHKTKGLSPYRIAPAKIPNWVFNLFKPQPQVFQVVSVISLNSDSADTNWGPPPRLLEIADSGGLRGVRCRQGPVAGVSASHATAAVSSQTSHSCRTGPLCSHHLCWSEGRTSSRGGNLQLLDVFLFFFADMKENTGMLIEKDNYKC